MKKKKEHKIKYKLTPDDEQRKETTWYPGHMAKALKQVQERIKKVDLVIEVRDARLPLMSANKEIHQLLGQKKKLILLNKSDLANRNILNLWLQDFEEKELHALAITSLGEKNRKEILDKLQHISDKEKLRVMIIGIPNCGKSSVINMLAQKKATRTANKPGLTTAQQWIRLSDQIELLDTPGIMPPKIENEYQAKALSAIHAIPDKILGKDEVALFILQSLISQKSTKFLSVYNIEAHVDPHKCFDAIGISRGAKLKGNSLDYDRIYQMIINDFRAGKLGELSFTRPE